MKVYFELRNNSVAVVRIIIIVDWSMQIQKKIPNNEKESKAGKLLDLYIRNNKKQALLVHTQQTANLQHISHLINTRFHVPPTDQLLFYNGQRIQPNEEQNILDVEDKGIIHLIDRRNITENLIINIRRLNVKRVEQFRVPSSQIIQDFIVRNIQQEEANRLFFVYTGRQLNPRNSFADQFVQNQSELFCLDQIKDQVIGEKRQKYSNRNKKSQKKVKQSPKQQLGEQKYLKTAHKIQNQPIKPQIASEQVQKREQKQQQMKLPNFRKKNISEEVNLANDIAINIHQANQQNNTSLVNDIPLQQNKSNLVPNPFFNQGSSISSIFLQENQNPESKRLDEASGMFNSVYMGLNNESIINQPNVNSRGGSIIANQSDSRDQQIKEQSSSSKTSFSFDNRAPQLFVPEKHALGTLEEEEMIIEQSKQDYTESKDLSVRDCQEQNRSRGSKVFRQTSKDLSGYQLQSFQNHQLSASADLEDQIFQNKQSPTKTKGNQILIEDFQRQQNKTLQFEGDRIEPIPYYHHQPQRQLNQQQENETNKSVNNNEQNVIQPPTRQVDIYLIEQDNLANPTQSQLIEQKEERQTNRYTNSNVYSSNSSRAKPYDINNQYNFGHFQRNNKNRLSGCKEETQKYDDPLQHSLSENNYHQNYKEEHVQVQNKQQRQDEHSLNIVQMPIQARIKNNSSLLLDEDSKYGQNYPHGFNPFSALSQQYNKAILDNQNSGIQELNKLFSVVKERPSKQNIQQGQKINNLFQNDRTEFYKQFDLLAKKQSELGKPSLIQTSLNFRMVKSASKNIEIQHSPVVFDSGIKGLLDSYQSFQKVQVKNNSGSNLNSYTRSLSNDLRFTSGRQIYNIGDFVFNCDRNVFNPLSFFIDVLDRQDSYQLLRSYP